MGNKTKTSVNVGATNSDGENKKRGFSKDRPAKDSNKKSKEARERGRSKKKAGPATKGERKLTRTTARGAITVARTAYGAAKKKETEKKLSN